MEKEKTKNEALNREERKNLQLFKKQAAQFPWLLREGDVWLKGWQSEEPLKKLRVLRNLLALVLALSMGLRYELNPFHYLFIPLLVLAALLPLSPLIKILFFSNGRKFGEYYPKHRNYIAPISLIIISLFGLSLFCIITFFYTSSLMPLVLPKEMDNLSLANALTSLFYFLSSIMIVFAIMGAWHVAQAIFLVWDYLKKGVS